MNTNLPFAIILINAITHARGTRYRSSKESVCVADERSRISLCEEIPRTKGKFAMPGG